MLANRPLSNDTNHLSEVILHNSQGEPFRTIYVDLTLEPKVLVVDALAYILENGKYSEVNHYIYQETF